VRSQVLVSLLISGVFWDEVKVFSADDEGSVHLGGDNGTSEDTATDGDETGERALLVCEVTKSVLVCLCNNDSSCLDAAIAVLILDQSALFPLPIKSPSNRIVSRFFAQIGDRRTDVVSLNGGLWCAESQSNVLVPSASSLANSRRLDLRLGVEEDVWLLLVSPLGLDGQFGCHNCVVVVKVAIRGCRGSSIRGCKGGWRVLKFRAFFVGHVMVAARYNANETNTWRPTSHVSLRLPDALFLPTRLDLFVDIGQAQQPRW